jgi:hypothetical protein
MATPNSNLGISYSFDATQFRNSIRFAMQMGAPIDPALRATFVFPESGTTTYTKNGDPVTNPRLDRDGVPLDPEIEITRPAPVEVAVDCSVEIDHVRPDEMPVGTYRPTRAVVTVLDEQYAQIKGCRELRFNGDRYLFDSEQYGLGLFGVGIAVMHFYAVDES